MGPPRQTVEFEVTCSGTLSRDAVCHNKGLFEHSNYSKVQQATEERETILRGGASMIYGFNNKRTITLKRRHSLTSSLRGRIDAGISKIAVHATCIGFSRACSLLLFLVGCSNIIITLLVHVLSVSASGHLRLRLSLDRRSSARLPLPRVGLAVGA